MRGPPSPVGPDTLAPRPGAGVGGPVLGARIPESLGEGTRTPPPPFTLEG